jgi:hypothetical protein
MLSPMPPDQMSEDLKRHNDEHARSSQSKPEQLVALLGIDPGTLQWAGETAASIIGDLASKMDDDRGCAVDIQNKTSDLTISQQGFFGGSTTYMLDSFPVGGVPTMEQGACGLDKGVGTATGAWGVLTFAMSTEYTLMVLFSVPYWGWTTKNTVGILGLKTKDHPSLKNISDPANGLWWFNQIYDGFQGKVAKAGNHATLTYEGYDIHITIDGKKDATAYILIEH